MKQKRLLLLMLLSSHAVVYAFDKNTEIARSTQTPLARNPDSKYFSFPLVNDANNGYGYKNRTQDILSFKPIVSYQVSQNYDLILRTIAPIFQDQPAGTSKNHHINGIGDINPTIFLSPMRYRLSLWGLGPTIFIPTASNKTIGSGKWSIGPELALFIMPKTWVLGILTSNVWSVAGDPKRNAVDQFSLQYFASYNFPQGWFITSQPTITANWKAPGNHVWTVPFGIGFGKSYHYTDGGVTLSLQSFYNAIRPSQLGPNWTLQAKVEFTLLDRKVIKS